MRSISANQSFDQYQKALSDFDKAMNELSNTTRSVKAIVDNGINVVVNWSNDWRHSEDGHAYFREVETPGHTKATNIIIAVVKENHTSIPAAFDRQRIIRVLEGKIINPISNKIYHQGQSFYVPAGIKVATDGVESAVILIQIIPKNSLPANAKVEFKNFAPKECNQNCWLSESPSMHCYSCQDS